MADPAQMLQVFSDYLILVQSEGRKPSDEDIDNFIAEFLKPGRNGFIFKRQYFLCRKERSNHRQPLV